MDDQADHRSRSPALNRVEGGVEIPLPRPGYCVAIAPTGALREADPAPAVAQGHRRDAQWVVLAGSCRRHGLYSVLPPSSVATPCLNASVSWPACAFYLFIRQLMGVGSQPCGAKYPGFCADSKGV